MSFEDFSILTKERNGFKLKIKENLLIVQEKPRFLITFRAILLLTSLVIACFMTRSPSILLCLYNCSLFSFQYYGTNFTILSKIKLMNIRYCFRHGHETSGFRKLALR